MAIRMCLGRKTLESSRLEWHMERRCTSFFCQDPGDERVNLLPKITWGELAGYKMAYHNWRQGLHLLHSRSLYSVSSRAQPYWF